MTTISRALIGAALSTAALAGSSCGYALVGKGSNLPGYIKVIAVVPCVNRTQLAEIDAMLTTELLNELQSRRIVVRSDPAGADAVLTCEVQRLDRMATSLNSQQQADRYAVNLVASVQLRDKHDNDKVLCCLGSQSATTNYPVAAGGADDPASYLRQNRTAMENLARDLAKRAVQALVEA